VQNGSAQRKEWIGSAYRKREALTHRFMTIDQRCKHIVINWTRILVIPGDGAIQKVGGEKKKGGGPKREASWSTHTCRNFFCAAQATAGVPGGPYTKPPTST